MRALHDFLAANRHKLAGSNGDNHLLAGVNSPALERYRNARARLAELDLQERENQLLPRDRVHDALSRLGALMRMPLAPNVRKRLLASQDLVDDGVRRFDEALSCL